MNFEIVRYLIKLVYREHEQDFTWTEEDFIRVFEAFYEKFEVYRGFGHKKMTALSIYRTMLNLQKGSAEKESYLPDDNIDLMDVYFSTNFRDCDYSIAHFASGKIRLFCDFEAM